MNSVGIIAFTRKGCLLALRLSRVLAESATFATAAFTVHGPQRFADELGIRAYSDFASWTAEHFASDDALVFVGASGIAVRAIAPYVRDKFTDPAVVSVDEMGQFAVPLLSGHVGGANDLARLVAQITGGQAVVSTATDVNNLFAVDEWAAKRGFVIVERDIAKEVSAALLSGEPVGVRSDFPLSWEDDAPLAADARLGGAGVATGASLGGAPLAASAPLRGAGSAAASRRGAHASDQLDAETLPAGLTPGQADIGFTVSLDDSATPFGRTLHVVPRAVTVGVGCRRGTETGVLRQAVDSALKAAGISPLAVSKLASIDIKRDEAALHELADERGWELVFYSAGELAAVPGEFATSEFVRETVGVDNVCERAALAEGGTLLLGKQAGNGATVALACRAL